MTQIEILTSIQTKSLHFILKKKEKKKILGSKIRKITMGSATLKLYFY